LTYLYLEMKQSNNIEVTGEVTQALPNAMFKVLITGEAPEELRNKELLCTLAGKMRLFKIRVMPGDQVRLEVTPYDSNRGRIVFRERQ